MNKVSNLPGIWRLLFHHEDGLVDVSREFHFDLLDPDDEQDTDNWKRTTSLQDFMSRFFGREEYEGLTMTENIPSLPVDYAYAPWSNNHVLIALPASSFIQAIEEGSECYKHYQSNILN